MTQDEKLRMYIANHKICTLATAMKDCKKCPFNVGMSKEEREKLLAK